MQMLRDLIITAYNNALKADLPCPACDAVLSSCFKAILRVLSNPAVLALLKIIWSLFKIQSNNEILRVLTIPVISP
jgi:hypothetical protein